MITVARDTLKVVVDGRAAPQDSARHSLHADPGGAGALRSRSRPPSLYFVLASDNWDTCFR